MYAIFRWRWQCVDQHWVVWTTLVVLWYIGAKRKVDTIRCKQHKLCSIANHNKLYTLHSKLEVNHSGYAASIFVLRSLSMATYAVLTIHIQCKIVTIDDSLPVITIPNAWTFGSIWVHTLVVCLRCTATNDLSGVNTRGARNDVLLYWLLLL